jgi:UDP-N-acetylmuramate dehydrogenase
MPGSRKSPAPIDGAAGAYEARLAAAVESIHAHAGLDVRLGEPMRLHTSLGIGGPADVYADALSVDGVSAAVRAAKASDVPLCVTGRGTNLLVLDGGFRGIVLHLGQGLSGMHRQGTRIVAEAGATLAEACEFAAAQGLSGLEFAAGVPGSVGGAAAMNAGAGEGQMADAIESVDVIRGDGALRTCGREELDFGYRRSCLGGKQCVAVRATLALRRAEPDEVRRVMFEAVARRCRKQPLSLGSCGSVFKRPEGDYAGRLLEVSGVKGLRIGGACFSSKHANFIVNEGNATAQDVVELIEVAKRRVLEQTGVELGEEVCIIGEP